MKIGSQSFNRFQFQAQPSATGGKRPAGDASLPAFSLKARPADAVVLTRAEAQSRPAHAQPSQAPQSAAKDAAPVAPLTAAPEAAAASRGTQATFGQSDLDAIRDSFGRRTGDEGFSEQADADGNGVIDFRDMTHVLANWGQTRS